MYNAGGSVSRTLISSKAMQHPGASWGCSKALPKQLCTARDKKLIFSKTDLLTLPCSDPLEDSEGKCWGLFLSCSHLSALSALVLMGNGNSKLLMADGWLVVMGLSGVCLHPPACPCQRKEMTPSGSNTLALQKQPHCCFKERASCGSVDFNVTVIILVSLRCH